MTQALRQIIANSKGPVIVDFFASWCPPCKALAPKFEAMAKEMTGATWVKVDGDKDKARQNWCLNLTEKCDFDGGVLSNLTYKWERGDGGGLSNWWLYLTEK